MLCLEMLKSIVVVVDNVTYILVQRIGYNFVIKLRLPSLCCYCDNRECNYTDFCRMCLKLLCHCFVPWCTTTAKILKKKKHIFVIHKF
jgi:hypothetical protein